ncbi:hypothetical protein KW790_02950 [Candidatus Parcubacteria bacterium]|nr:hypothetical protein [Candidatus Parcubacteria bacterium]
MSTHSADDEPLTDSEWERISALFPHPGDVSHLVVTELRDNGYVPIEAYPGLTEALLGLMNVKLEEAGMALRFVATPEEFGFNERTLDIKRIR